MSKAALRTLFIVGVLVFSIAFMALTMDTLGQVPARTNEQNLTEQVVAGKLAWQRHDCIDCHTILGNGAYYAPDLTKVARTRGAAFLRTWLKNPGGQMPNQRLTDQEVEDLIAFLGWVSEIDTNDWPPAPLGATPLTPGTPSPSQDLAAQGAALFQSKGCTACHGRQGEGSAIAPSLIGVSAKYDVDYLSRWLKDPSVVKPGATMPNLGLSQAEIEALVAHLQTLR